MKAKQRALDLSEFCRTRDDKCPKMLVAGLSRMTRRQEKLAWRVQEACSSLCRVGATEVEGKMAHDHSDDKHERKKRAKKLSGDPIRKTTSGPKDWWYLRLRC